MHSRTLANLIHDRLWDHLATAVDEQDDVAVLDSGVHRELQVGFNLRIRVKRHSEKDLISNYRTQTAVLFYEQPLQLTLDGETPITLAIGYRWDDELRAIAAPVVSYREGIDNPRWSVELDEPQDGATAITWHRVPDLPDVDFREEPDEEAASGTDEAR